MDQIDQGATEEVSKRYPKEVQWDPLDPRLLVVQAAPVHLPNEQEHMKKPASGR